VLAGLWSSAPVRKWGLRILGAHAAVALLARPLFGDTAGTALIAFAPILLAIPVIGLWPSAVRATDLEARAKSG
ncbi:MAG: hypothetical protein PVH47_05325, partial [Thiohalocapsa sp.]